MHVKNLFGHCDNKFDFLKMTTRKALHCIKLLFINCHRTEVLVSFSIIAAVVCFLLSSGKLNFLSISPEASWITSTVNGNDFVFGVDTFSFVCIFGAVRTGQSGFDLNQDSISLYFVSFFRPNLKKY